MKKLITIFFFLSLSFLLNSQKSSKNQIEILNKTRLRIESDIKIRQDSLKLINQKIDLFTQEELLNKLKAQPEGMVIKAIVSGPGKIRKGNNPNSTVLTQVNTSDTVLLTDYIDSYWVVNKGKYFGYIHEMFIKDSPDLIDFKNSLIARQERIEAQKSEENLKIKAQQDAENRKLQALKNVEDLKIKKAILEQKKINLNTKYGTEIANKILDGRIWLGMTDAMAKDSWGQPNENNRTVGSWGVHEQWVYSRKNTYLYFENGILTSWQD